MLMLASLDGLAKDPRLLGKTHVAEIIVTLLAPVESLVQLKMGVPTIFAADRPRRFDD